VSENAELIAMLRQSADSYLASNNALTRARAWRTGHHEALATHWRGFAELGWCGMLAPEAAGGTAFGLAEAAALHEVLGSQLVPEPLLLGAHLPVLALADADSEAALALTAALAEGMSPATLVWQARPGVLSAEDTAIRNEGGKLTGEAQVVVLTAPAAPMIVAARAASGVALYRIAPDAQGVSITPSRLDDGTTLAHVVLSAVAPEALLVPAPQGGAALDAALDAGRILMSAELLGAMRAAFAMTLDYLKTRKQFGKPIGSFQALQHRAVDLHVEIELSSAALDAALAQWADADPATRAALASGVKARACDAALKVAREAIQLHGAIAYTDEHDAGLYLARIMTLAALLGNGTAHRKRYLALVQAA
jgi:3-oxochol-4-en-24-oyl-CoA dehydrogenase